MGVLAGGSKLRGTRRGSFTVDMEMGGWVNQGPTHAGTSSLKKGEVLEGGATKHKNVSKEMWSYGGRGFRSRPEGGNNNEGGEKGGDAYKIVRSSY